MAPRNSTRSRSVVKKEMAALRESLERLTAYVAAVFIRRRGAKGADAIRPGTAAPRPTRRAGRQAGGGAPPKVAMR